MTNTHLIYVEQESEALYHLKNGNTKEAEKIYRELIATGKANHKTYVDLATICITQKRWEELVELIKLALEIEPNYPEAHNNLGIGLKEKGDLETAINSFKTALSIRPNYPEAYNNMGIALQEQGNLHVAISSFKAALKIRPRYPEAQNNLGNALQEQGLLTKALICYEKAIKTRTNYVEAHINMGIALYKNGDHKAAINSYKNAIKYQANHPDAHYNLGVVLHEGCNIKAAITSYKNAIKCRPNHRKAQLNLAILELLNGDYINGWKRYEYRFQSQLNQKWIMTSPPHKRWNGERLKPTEHLFLINEQGIGDMLQFMRYAIALRRQGIALSIIAPKKLHGLIKSSGLDALPLTPHEIHKANQALWIPLLSLPIHLKINPNNPIITKPYIKTTDKLLKKWKRALSTYKKPIIGINWRGNRNDANKENRNVPIEHFESLFSSFNGNVVSLQRGACHIESSHEWFKHKLVNEQEKIFELANSDNSEDFLEYAAVVANCDLVITTSTTVAHLAAGMGKPTWVLLPKVPDWRWGLHGETTFWYPCMQLFRQTEKGDWTTVIARVTTALKEFFPKTKSSPKLIAKARMEEGVQLKKASEEIKLRDTNILCISLVESIERRQKLTTISKKFKLNLSFIEAVNADNLTQAALQEKTQITIQWDVLKNYTDNNRLIIEAARCLSHIKAWRTILNYNLDHAMIIEDYFELQGTESVSAPRRADLIYLTRDPNIFTYEEDNSDILCAKAYFLKKECCKKLLKIFSTIKMPLGIQWLPQTKNLIDQEHPLSTLKDTKLPTIYAFLNQPDFSHRQ